LLAKLFKEPTFHFLVLAAAISIAYWILNSQSGKQLLIDREEIEAQILVTELTQGYQASEAQRVAIESALIDDYILVMEAYEMGLQNDARINDILAQKMRHVLSGNVIQPTEQELEEFYLSNIERYTIEKRVTADEVVFDTQGSLPPVIRSQLAQGSVFQNTDSDLRITAGVLPRVTLRDLSSIFNAEFANSVFTSQPGIWLGPYLSNRGQHWLKVTDTHAEATAELNEITDQVRLDWIVLEEESRLEQEISRLREEYTISIQEQD
jgi:hypothetical protein